LLKWLQKSSIFLKSIELKFIKLLKILLISLVILHVQLNSIAQDSVLTSNADTIREIQIIQGNSLREKSIDSATRLQTISGNVILKEGLTLFYCDSAIINKETNVLEAFGNIHINQNDSINTYSQYLKYIGKDRIAFLKKEVRLTDKKGTLYTQELEYNLATSIGKYKNGGKVINGKTILTSTEGIYYADTKDIFFKKKVHLTDPKYDIITDTLLYNTQTQISSWNTPTKIKSENGGDIYSSNGTYDLKNGKAYFGNRTIIKDSTRTYVADKSAYDEVTGIAQLEGNAIIKDSVNGYSILGNQIYLDKNNNSFLATRKPVLIFKGEGNDSTYVSADTLFSGVEKRDSLGRKIEISRDTLKADSVIDNSKSLPIKNNNTDNIIKKNSLDSSNRNTDSTIIKNTIPTTNNILQDSFLIKKVDTLINKITPLDSSNFFIDKIDTSQSTIVIPVTETIKKDTAIRYFIAFHNVRIFNDSLQSVADSLYYSSEDSIFRLLKNPIVFSNNSQISGDTIFIYTKNKKAERLYVFDNGIIINKLNIRMYNQIAGRTLNGYFKNGELDYMRAKGLPAESIFYPQDEDSAFIGMNRSKGDLIDLYFKNKEINKVKFVKDVEGTFYPIRQIPEKQRLLNNFLWQEKRRPKNKFELFE
jgi:lipopolysaccharide export system protein LptA